MGQSLNWPGLVCGLESEARIARQFLSRVAVSGGRPEQARRMAQRLLDQGANGLISFGIAGGLDPALKTGDLVIGSEIAGSDQTIAADADWLAILSQQLPMAKVGPVLGHDEIIFEPADKVRAFNKYAALAVDMESHAVAQVALTNGKPFAVLRAIADDASIRLPPMVGHGLDAQGRPQLAAILMRLALAPWELPALMRAGQATNGALRTLLGRSGFGLISLGSFGRMDI